MQEKGQFSLGWVVPAAASVADNGPALLPEPQIVPAAAVPRSQGQTALDDAVVFYSQPLISHLKEAPDQEMRLHDLARAAGNEIANFEFEKLPGVVHRLAEMGILQIVEEDPLTGNHLVKLLRTR